MAEAFLRRYGQKRFEARSAGITPKSLDDRVLEVMTRAGIDMSAHRAKALTEFAGEAFDFVITVAEEARGAAIPLDGGTRLIHWRFQDPDEAEGSPLERRKVLQRVRDEIAARVRLFAYAQSRRADSLERELALRRTESGEPLSVVAPVAVPL